MTHASIPAEDREKLGISDSLVSLVIPIYVVIGACFTRIVHAFMW